MSPDRVIQKTEHFYYFLLIMLSVGISLLEWFSGSQSLRTLSLHMIFHVIFFIALWVSAGRAVTSGKNWSWVMVIILAAFTAYRIFDMVTAIDSAVNGALLLITVLLLIFQNVILHQVKNRECSVLCHISQVHITGDIVAIILIGVVAKVFSPVWTHRLDLVISSLVIAYMWVLLGRYISRQRHQ